MCHESLKNLSPHLQRSPPGCQHSQQLLYRRNVDNKPLSYFADLCLFGLPLHSKCFARRSSDSLISHDKKKEGEKCLNTVGIVFCLKLYLLCNWANCLQGIFRCLSCTLNCEHLRWHDMPPPPELRRAKTLSKRSSVLIWNAAVCVILFKNKQT